MEEYFKDVLFYVSRPETVQRDDLCYVVSESGGNDVKVITVPLDGKNRGVYLGKRFALGFDQWLFENINSRDGFENNKKRYEQLKKEYASTIEILKNTAKNKKEVFKNYNLFLENLGNSAVYVRTPFVVENVIDKKMSDLLREKHPNDFVWMYHAIVSPTESHEYQNMRRDICHAIIKKIPIDEAARKLTEKYSWYGEYSFIEPLLDEIHFTKELNKLSLETAKFEYEKINSDLMRNQKEFKKALGLIKDPTLKLYAEIVNKYVLLRTARIDLLKKIQAGARSVYDKIAELLTDDSGEKWERKDVVELTNEEIINYLGGGQTPDLKKTMKRAGGYVYVRDIKGTQMIIDKVEIEKIVGIIKKSQENSNIVKGKVAHKGKAKGKVALVFGKSDLAKVTGESVLVARTTMVDYIHAMERAVAFVTEEGGITSHAAVVSRELKKPCIVGTGNCTTMLKDGDMVEVDADAGIVKILK